MSPEPMRVISARVPAAVAEALEAEAVRQGVRPSGLLRRAVEGMLGRSPATLILTASAGTQMRVVTDLPEYTTGNVNPVVEIPAEPAHLVVLGDTS